MGLGEITAVCVDNSNGAVIAVDRQGRLGGRLRRRCGGDRGHQRAIPYDALFHLCGGQVEHSPRCGIQFK
mgnify:CR=1